MWYYRKYKQKIIKKKKERKYGPVTIKKNKKKAIDWSIVIKI